MSAQLLAAAIGIAVMAAPSLFGYGGIAADIDHIAGPIVASLGIMAASQILRALRWANVAIGGLLVATAPFLGRPLDSVVVAVAAGSLLLVTGLVRGTVDEDFGGGWSDLLNR